MTDIQFVPKSEFDRLGSLELRPLPRTALFATLCRINALYMIARARSGHIGSSFSSLDIVSWLYLNELRAGDGETAANLYFSSKGHDAPGLYAVLLALGVFPSSRSICFAGSGDCRVIPTSQPRGSSPTPARSAWGSRRRRG